MAPTPHMIGVFRFARPVSDLARAEAMYCAGLDWVRLAGFDDHQGFDGVILGVPGAPMHFEFTLCRHHPVAPTPTPEDLWVFYLPEAAAWHERCAALLGAGFVEVAPFNPYWGRHGRSFADPDGYRLVLQCAAWGGAAPAPG